MSSVRETASGGAVRPPLPVDPFGYCRRPTRVVQVGDVGIGGANPIRVQTMTTTRTQDIASTVAQVIRVVAAGAELVRITAPTVRDAQALGEIKRRLRAQGVTVPLVADIHFSPAAALEAALHVEKVRINPGNYADTKTFAVREYSDAEYQAELERIEERFKPLVLRCKELGVALRIGTNHGSLSDRIMNRYGDTPEGMVESALEFVRICERYGFRDIVLSMKASNPKVMVQANRLLVARMAELGMDYPIHLGVTEAGNGEDGRIKSAVGIGTLLDDGIGDTVRVSLAEDPEHEIPVARRLVAPYNALLAAQAAGHPPAPAGTGELPWTPGGLAPVQDRPRERRGPLSYARRRTEVIDLGGVALGGDRPVAVLADPAAPSADGAFAPDLALQPGAAEPGAAVAAYDLAPHSSGGRRDRAGEGVGRLLEARVTVANVAAAVAALLEAARRVPADGRTALGLRAANPSALVRAARLLAARLDAAGLALPLVLTVEVGAERDDALLRAAVALGSPLCDGIGDGVRVVAPPEGPDPVRLAFDVLQASGARITRTDFVACPSCGRTLFDLPTTTDRIRAKLGHLSGLKIAVMGCVVNGPGEMADADFGYVGGAPGKVNLYVGKELVERNVPQEEADERLIALIRSRGRWQDPS